MRAPFRVLQSAVHLFRGGSRRKEPPALPLAPDGPSFTPIDQPVANEKLLNRPVSEAVKRNDEHARIVGIRIGADRGNGHATAAEGNRHAELLNGRNVLGPVAVTALILRRRQAERVNALRGLSG